MIFKKHWKADLDEIQEYIIDLQRITLLRDKCHVPEERERYSTAIMVMQEVLIKITTPPGE